MTMQIDHAIILAAGRGSRMGGLTEAQPKCCTPFAGQRLIDWQLAALRSAGMHHVTIIGGYRAESLRDEADALIINTDWALTNMVASLRCAAEVLAKHAVIVSYSDIVYRSAHLRSLSACSADIAISYDRDWLALWRERFSDPLSDAETFLQQDGWLRKIGQGASTLSQIQGQYMGLLRITPRGWAHIEHWLSRQSAERIAKLDMTSLLSALLAEGAHIGCVAVHGGWCEVDSDSDLQAYEAALQQAHLNGNTWHHDWRS